MSTVLASRARAQIGSVNYKKHVSDAVLWELCRFLPPAARAGLARAVSFAGGLFVQILSYLLCAGVDLCLYDGR